jgi:hypothetical protein
LEEGINQLLQNPASVKALYEHPLMKSLSKDGKLPSYIPPRTFVLSLISVITGSVSGCKEICEKLTATPDSPLSRQLLPLIQSAQGNLDQAFKNVENWFNSAMDRIAGWYKRWIMAVTVIISLIVCTLLNADSIMVAKLLWTNPTLRTNVAGAAEGFIQSQQSPSPNHTVSMDSAATELTFAVQQAKLANFPLGWKSEFQASLLPKIGNEIRAIPANSNKSAILWWSSKIVGILFTVLAISLGAPFWFDVLNRFVKLRSSGARVENRQTSNES